MDIWQKDSLPSNFCAYPASNLDVILFLKKNLYRMLDVDEALQFVAKVTSLVNRRAGKFRV